jgi:hypothetical protein
MPPHRKAVKRCASPPNMKYLFVLTIFLSCKSGPRKVIVAHSGSNTTTQMTIHRDTSSIDTNDPYETGYDTVRLNKAMDKIFKFPEVEAINKQIDKTTNGKHGVSIMVHDQFNGDTSFYHFRVGDNSHEDRYVNVFDFLLYKQTNEIKAYDPTLDTVLSLQEWRKTRK